MQIYSHEARIGEDRTYYLTGFEDVPFAKVFIWDDDLEVYQPWDYRYYNNSIVVVGEPGDYIRILVVK
jgi:hypothetical protein